MAAESAEATQRLRDDPISGSSERKFFSPRVCLQDLQFIVAEHRYDAIDPRVLGRARSRARRTPSTGAKIELIELKRRVSYADLDLSKHADVIELETRVETISKESCQKLFDMFLLDSATEMRRCIKKAIESTEEQVQAAIVAAS